MAASPTEGLPVAAQAKFKLLQQRFVHGLAARWTEVSTASTPTSQRDALHRLVGGAGSYGFAHMSQLASEAENVVSAGPSDELDLALSALKREIDAALANTPPGP